MGGDWMTWGQRSQIPQSVKNTVRRRDGAKGGCQLRYPGICTGRIDEFDHIDGLADQGRQRNDRPVTAEELQGVCEPCHEHKTEQQRLAGIARAVRTRGSLSKRYRDREPHPGEIISRQKGSP